MSSEPADLGNMTTHLVDPFTTSAPVSDPLAHVISTVDTAGTSESASAENVPDNAADGTPENTVQGTSGQEADENSALGYSEEEEDCRTSETAHVVQETGASKFKKCPKRSKTKAEREETHGTKPGNPGRFQGEPLTFLTGLLADYRAIDKRKGSRGKNKRLEAFWTNVCGEFWQRFSWEMFEAPRHEGEKDNVVKDIDNVGDMAACTNRHS